QWVMNAKRQSEVPDRDRLREALLAEWPAKVTGTPEGERIFLTREGKGDRVPAILLKGSGSAAVVVHPDGAEAARALPEVGQLQKQGRTVLLIDAFQTGTAVAPRDRSHRHFLTFNKSDDANRVQDILTALAYANGTELYGVGKAAVWCTFAAAVAPR